MVRPGRNEACWCGSGKKYKRCHLREDQAADRAGLEQGLSEEAEVELIRRRVLELRELMLPGACLEGLRFDPERFGDVLSEHLDEVLEPVGGDFLAVDPRTGRLAWEAVLELGHEHLVGGGHVARARAALKRAESARGLSRAQRDAIRMGLSTLWMDEQPGEGGSPVVSALFPLQFTEFVQAYARVDGLASELGAWAAGLPAADSAAYAEAVRRAEELQLDQVGEVVAQVIVGDARSLLDLPDLALLSVDEQHAVRSLSKLVLSETEAAGSRDTARRWLFARYDAELGPEVLTSCAVGASSPSWPRPTTTCVAAGA